MHFHQHFPFSYSNKGLTTYLLLGVLGSVPDPGVGACGDQGEPCTCSWMPGRKQKPVPASSPRVYPGGRPRRVNLGLPGDPRNLPDEDLPPLDSRHRAHLQELFHQISGSTPGESCFLFAIYLILISFPFSSAVYCTRCCPIRPGVPDHVQRQGDDVRTEVAPGLHVLRVQRQVFERSICDEFSMLIV